MLTLPLNEQTLSVYQAEYDLTYHVRWCIECQNKVGFKNKDVLEVGGSLPKDFVLGGLKAKSWTAIEGMEYYEELTHRGQMIGGQIQQQAPLSFEEIKMGATLPSDYGTILGNIEDLPKEMESKYDLIFSIAAFEHIARMGKGLSRMFAALRPGGILFAMASPIWSSRIGHHHPIIDGNNGEKYTFNTSPLPPYSHLLLRPPEMTKYLIDTVGLSEDIAEDFVYYVYHSPQINRLFTEDYIQYAYNSPFEVKNLSLTGQAHMKPELQTLLESRHPGMKHFSNAGVLMILKRPDYV